MDRDTVITIPFLDSLESLLTILWRVAGLVVLIVVGYYGYAAVAHPNELFRGVGPTGGAMSSADFQRHLSNMQMLTQGMGIATMVFVVCLILRYYAYPEAGGGLLVGGAVFFFAAPMLIDAVAGNGQMPAALARLGNPKVYLKSQFGMSGLVMCGAGVIDLIAHAILMFASASSRRPRANAESAETAAQVRKPNDRFLGYCWELPFCRDTEKKLCPVRARKQPCWRSGRGCYCDQNIILQLSGGSYAASRGTAGYLSRTATVVRPKTWAEKREQCLGCPVYLHRQGQKYKVLAPASIIACITAAVLFWPQISKAYPTTVLAAGRAMSGFSFGQSQGGVPAWATDLATNPTLMWLLLGTSLFLAVSYVLHGFEWLLYKLGV